MGTKTRRFERRLLSFFMAMAVLFTFAVPSAPAVFAEDPLPDNIELLFNETSGSDGITVSDDGKQATYDMKAGYQTVNISFKMSLNRSFEEGQLRIVIPYVGFRGRDGEKQEMSNSAVFFAQVNSSSSLLTLVEDNRSTDGTLVYTNKEFTAMQCGLKLQYDVGALQMKDKASQEFKVTVTDTATGEDLSPAPLNATFLTYVKSLNAKKNC